MVFMLTMTKGIWEEKGKSKAEVDIEVKRGCRS